MIGLDTNVLVRYIMQDDAKQSLQATKIIEALDSIVRCKQFKLESADQVIRALRVFQSGKSDFADCLIERTANSADCEKTITFDANASQYAGMTLIL